MSYRICGTVVSLLVLGGGTKVQAHSLSYVSASRALYEGKRDELFAQSHSLSGLA